MVEAYSRFVESDCGLGIGRHIVSKSHIVVLFGYALGSPRGFKKGDGAI